MVERMTLLKELCSLYGPSNCEGDVAHYIISKLKGEEYSTDNNGNVIVKIPGDNSSDKKVMIGAHMDEVGFIVSHIDDDGYIHFMTLGGIDSRVICGRKVVFGHEGRWITGIIGSKAIHQQSAEERKNPTDVENMYADIGAKNREEAEKYVTKGDFGTFSGDFVTFGNGFIRSKAIDDRLGCAAMLEIIDRLHEEKRVLPYDLYLAFTTKEEIGLCGMNTAAFTIKPDYAIELESTAVSDTNDTPASDKVAFCSQGAIITQVDGGTIYDPDFVKLAFDTAAKYGIKAQPKRYISGANDSRTVQTKCAGAKVLAISAPSRYIHTPSNVISQEDYYSICELTYALLGELCDI